MTGFSMPRNTLSTRFAAGVFATLGVCTAYAAEPGTTPLVQLASVSGEVLVDQGETLSPATSGMTLKPFDRVMVLDQGKVTLAYRDGCRDELSGPTMRTVTTEAACVAAQAAASPEAMALEQVATSQGVETAGLAILGVASAGGIIWAATDDDNNNAPPPPPSSITVGGAPLSP